MNSAVPVISQLSLETHFGTTLVARLDNGQLGHALVQEDSPLLVPVVALGVSSIPDYVFLTAPTRFLPLNVMCDPRISTVLAFQVCHQEDKKISLRSPVSSKSMSFLPDRDDATALVVCDRDAVFEWEMLSNGAPPIITDDPLLKNIGMAIAKFRHPGVIELDRPRLMDARVAGVQTLPGKEMEKLSLLNDIVSLPWIRKAEELRL